MLVPRREFRLALNRDSQVFLTSRYYNTNTRCKFQPANVSPNHFFFFSRERLSHDEFLPWNNATISRSTAQISPSLSPIESIVVNQCFIPRRRQEKFEHIFPPCILLAENCRLKLSGARSHSRVGNVYDLLIPLGCIFHARNEE